jgi:hypothetical protein
MDSDFEMINDTHLENSYNEKRMTILKTIVDDNGDEYKLTETEYFNFLDCGLHLYYDQEEMFSKVGENKFCYAYDVYDEKNPYDEEKKTWNIKKRYGTESSVESFISKYNNFSLVSPNEIFFYEMLRTDSPRYEYYDCDNYFDAGEIYSTRDPQQFFRYFEILRNKFIRSDDIISKIYGGIESDWRILESSDSTKMSLHIINRNNVFSNHEENKIFADRFLDYIKTFEPEFNGIIDKSVYSKNRLFRLINSTKKGSNRPFVRAEWHKKSISALTKEFFVSNVDVKKIGIKPKLTKIQKIESKIAKDEQKIDKKIKKFSSSFETMETTNEFEDEVELLLILIGETIKNKKSSLCDSTHPDKINYGNLMKLSFAYLNSLSEERQQEALNFWRSDIYPLYRHASDHNPLNIWNSFFNSKPPPSPITIATLHFLAKENPEYNNNFKKKVKSFKESIGIFDINDKSYYWHHFFRDITSKIWASKDELLEFFVKNFPRVCNVVLGGIEEFYLKIDESNNYNNQNINLGDIYYFYLHEGEQIKASIRFNDIWNNTRSNFIRYESIKFNPYDIYDGTGRAGPRQDGIKLGNPLVINTFEHFKANLIRGKNESTLVLENLVGYDLILPILNHIKEVWADNNMENFSYIISWLAHIVKFPNQLTKTMITLLSDNEQVGKGIIVEWFINEILGRSISGKTGEFDNIVGRFNSFINNKIFIALDEMNNHESYREGSFNKFKTYITDSTQTVEIKGKEPITITNYVNYFCLSNQPGAVKISNGDKRIAVFECSDKYSGNRAYFDNLASCLRNEESSDLFFTYLYMLPDRERVDPRNIPLNESKKNMAKITMEQPRKFLFEIKYGEYVIENSSRRIMRSYDEDEEEKKEGEKILFTADELFEQFNIWLIKSSEKLGKYSKNKFLTTIRSNINKKRMRIGGKYQFEYDITTINL